MTADQVKSETKVRRVGKMAQEAVTSADAQRQRWDTTSVQMLAIIMASLTMVFLGGMGIMLYKGGFDSADIVAVISPALAAVGTVAAGVFGYTLGSVGTAEAQQTASAATQEMGAARQEAAASAQEATSLARSVQHIVNRAEAGEQSEPGKRHVSLDDLKTLSDGAAPLVARLRARA